MAASQPTIFETHYHDYLGRIADVDLARRASVLGAAMAEDQMRIPLFGTSYAVSGAGMADESGRRPPYAVCVVLAKYILECPQEAPENMAEWASYKDFKDAGPLITYFTNDVERALSTAFSGRLPELSAACSRWGGSKPEIDLSYDLALQFTALPRVAMLLLFNDADAEFPARCAVLFQRSAERHLDMESVAVLGKLFADLLIGRKETR